MSSWMNKIFSAGSEQNEQNLDQSTDPYRNPSDVPAADYAPTERPGKIVKHEFTPRIIRYRFILNDGTQFAECIMKSTLPAFDKFERRPDGSYERVCYDRHGIEFYGPHSSVRDAYDKFNKTLDTFVKQGYATVHHGDGAYTCLLMATIKKIEFTLENLEKITWTEFQYNSFKSNRS